MLPGSFGGWQLGGTRGLLCCPAPQSESSGMLIMLCRSSIVSLLVPSLEAAPPAATGKTATERQANVGCLVHQ